MHACPSACRFHGPLWHHKGPLYIQSLAPLALLPRTSNARMRTLSPQVWWPLMAARTTSALTRYVHPTCTVCTLTLSQTQQLFAQDAQSEHSMEYPKHGVHRTKALLGALLNTKCSLNVAPQARGAQDKSLSIRRYLILNAQGPAFVQTVNGTTQPCTCVLACRRNRMA